MARRLIKGLDTKLIHAGEPEPLIGGAVSMPIFPRRSARGRELATV